MTEKTEEKKTETTGMVPVKRTADGERLIAGIPESKALALDAVVAEYGLDTLRDGKHGLLAALRVAEGVVRLRESLTDDVMKAVLVLQGTNLGFRTDKDDSGGYDGRTVRDCLIEASMRGLSPVGNEWNIIGRRLYITLQGYERLVRELAGLTDLELRLELRAEDVREGGIDVGFAARWKLDGTPRELAGSIPVRINKGMGADGALGKARRKALARVYQRVTGSAIIEGDVTDGDPFDERPIVSVAPGTPAVAPPSSGPKGAARAAAAARDKIWPAVEASPPLTRPCVDCAGTGNVERGGKPLAPCSTCGGSGAAAAPPPAAAPSSAPAAPVGRPREPGDDDDR